MNDNQRVAKLFRNSGGAVIMNYQIKEGKFYGTKPIMEHTGRIIGARKILGCICGNIQKIPCTGVEHIVYLGENKYQYINKYLGYKTEIKPSRIVKQQPEMPQKAEMNEEARVRWEATRTLLTRPRLPVVNYERSL